MEEEETLMMGGGLSSEKLKQAQSRHIERNYDARARQARRARRRTDHQIERARTAGQRGGGGGGGRMMMEEEEAIQM